MMVLLFLSKKSTHLTPQSGRDNFFRMGHAWLVRTFKINIPCLSFWKVDGINIQFPVYFTDNFRD